MARSVLVTAKHLLKCRRFSRAIALLEGNRQFYRDNADFYVTCGIACLYVGDYGTANSYFNQARKITLTNLDMLLGQAAFFLHRGDTDRAVEYYLEVLDNHPENKIARRAMDFIREDGSFESVCRMEEAGTFRKFYPPLGVNPLSVFRIAVSALIGIGIALSFLCYFAPKDYASGRADLSELVLSSDEKKNAQEKDLSGGVYRYILTDSQIRDSYEKALQYFQDGRDNAANVEVNRILNSNASQSIQKKSSLLLTYFEEPTFDSLTDNYQYVQVVRDPVLFLGCWVSWSGRITNAVSDSSSYRCDLLVGYENLEKVDGIVPVYFSNPPVPEIEGDRPVTILAKIGVEGGKITLNARAVHQKLRNQQ